MTLLETLQYERELCDIEGKSNGAARFYKENPEELGKMVDEVKQFRYKVAMSKIKDWDKNPIVNYADRLLEMLGCKQDSQNDVSMQIANQAKEKNDSILSYIIPLGLMLIPMILDEIFPKKYENKDGVGATEDCQSYLNIPGDNKSD